MPITYHIRNQNGQGLIQIMISLGITSIIMFAMMSMFGFQNRESKALSEKLSSLDFQRTITQALASRTTCGANMFAAPNLANASALPFDATSISVTNPYIIALKELPSSNGGPALAKAGGSVSSLANSLFLMPETGAPAGIQVRVTSLTPPTATLLLNFDTGKLVRGIKNLEFPVNLKITGPLTATLITGCSTGSSSSKYCSYPSSIDCGGPGSLWFKEINNGIYMYGDPTTGTASYDSISGQLLNLNPAVSNNVPFTLTCPAQL